MPTKIEWADEIYNPVTGCDPISEGCAHCYARRMSKRLAGRFGYPVDEPFRVTLHPDRLEQPLRWRKSKRVFVCSMGDWAHPDIEVLDSCYVQEIFAIMALCPQHTFMLLTKRPISAKYTLSDSFWPGVYHAALDYAQQYHPRLYGFVERGFLQKYYLENVWLGVSVENQRHTDRLHELMLIPAAMRYVSLEPLLGPVDIKWWLPSRAEQVMKKHSLGLPTLDWVIVGAETGPGARPMDPDWARDIRDQCKAAGVPFFFKAMSGRVPIPDDLMMREFPA